MAAAGGRGPHEVAGGKLGVTKVWEVERAESLQGRESSQGRSKAGGSYTQWLEDDTKTVQGRAEDLGEKLKAR